MFGKTHTEVARSFRYTYADFFFFFEQWTWRVGERKLYPTLLPASLIEGRVSGNNPFGLQPQWITCCDPHCCHGCGKSLGCTEDPMSASRRRQSNLRPHEGSFFSLPTRWCSQIGGLFGANQGPGEFQAARNTVKLVGFGLPLLWAERIPVKS